MRNHPLNTAIFPYSFGMLLQSYANAEWAYGYGFQGQEMDNEIKGDGNSINYKYRMHDPRLGRFFAVDPLAGKYPYYSPYAFSANRVIDMVEQEGLQPGYTTQHFYGLSLKITIPTFNKIETNLTYALNLPYYNTPAYDFAQIKPKAEFNLLFKNLYTPLESVLLQGQYKFNHTADGGSEFNVFGELKFNIGTKVDGINVTMALKGKGVERTDVMSQEHLDLLQFAEITKPPLSDKQNLASGTFNIDMNSLVQNTQTTPSTNSNVNGANSSTPVPSMGGGSGMGQLHFDQLKMEGYLEGLVNLEDRGNNGTQIGHLKEDGSL